MFSRRHWLTGLGALVAGAPLRAWGSSVARPPNAESPPTIESLRGKVRIRDLKIIPVSAGARAPYIFVQVATDAGVAGLGEATLDSNPRAVISALRDLRESLVGKDPTMIEHIWQATYRRSFRGGGPAFNAALGGIDVALWDIRGKLLGEPIWKLLGGPLREKIRVYTHFGGRTPAETAEQAERLVATGFRALKMVPHVPNGRAWGSQPVREIPRHLHAARQAVGADVDLMVDANGFSLALAPEAARELEALHLLWVEEPALPEHTEALRRISEETSLPIATGQHLYTLWGFREVFQKEIAAVIQPDMVHAGGISQLRKIAIMAEAYYVAMAPHNALSPVTTAACLHLDAAIPNFLIQEVVHGNHDRASVLNEPVEKVTDGHIPLPTRPGLGVELDEATVTRLGYT